MLGLEFFAGLLAAIIAPNNGIVVRLAGMIPAHDGLTLIGDSHSSQFLDLKPRIGLNGIGHRNLDAQFDILNDFLRIVFEPSLGRRDLFVLNEVLADQLALRGVDCELGRGGGLVQ